MMKKLTVYALFACLVGSSALAAEECPKDAATGLSCHYGIVSEAQSSGTITLAHRVSSGFDFDPIVKILFQPKGSGKLQTFVARLDEQKHFQARLHVAGKAPGWLDVYGVWDDERVVALAEYAPVSYRSQGRCDPFATMESTAWPTKDAYVLLGRSAEGRIENDNAVNWHPLFSALKISDGESKGNAMTEMNRATYLLSYPEGESGYTPNVNSETNTALSQAERGLFAYEETLLGSYCDSDKVCREAGNCCPMMEVLGTSKQCSPEHFALARDAVPTRKALLDEKEKHPGCGSFMMSSRPNFFTEKHYFAYGPYRITVEAGSGANMHNRCSWDERKLRLYRLDGNIATPLYSTRGAVKYN